MECNHKRKHLKVGQYGGDVDLANIDLMRELWIAELLTIDDCESDPDSGMISIAFANSHGAEDFLSIVKLGEDKDANCNLAERATSFESECDDIWKVNLVSFSLTGDDIRIGVRVLIPESDYDEVLRRVKEYNK